RPSPAERRGEPRQRAMLVPRAQQQLGRPQAASGQEYTLGPDAASRARATANAVELHAITALVWCDALDEVERTDLATITLRAGQIRDVEAVLCADLAADVAMSQ